MSGQTPRQSLPRHVKDKKDVNASIDRHTRNTRRNTFLCEPLPTDAEEGGVGKLKIRKLNLSEEKVQKNEKSKLVTKSKRAEQLKVEKSVKSRAVTESPLASRKSLNAQHPKRKSKKYSDESPLTPTSTDSADSSNVKSRSMLRRTPKKSYKEEFIANSESSYSSPKKNSNRTPLKRTKKLPSSSSDKNKKHPELSPVENSNEYPSTSRRATRNTPKKKIEDLSTNLKGNSSCNSSPIQNRAKTRQKLVNQHSNVNSKKKSFEPSPSSTPKLNESSETHGTRRSSRKPGLRAKIRLNYTETDFVYYENFKVDSTNFIPPKSDSESGESDCDTQTQSSSESSDDESSIKEEIKCTIAFSSENCSLDPSEKVKCIKRSRFGDGILTLEDFDTFAHPEIYFVAENRIKYASSKKSEPVMNDVRKGKKVKKPRKGERGLGGRKATLPQKPIYKYSVTKESTRAAASRNIIVDTNKHPKECNTIMDNLVSDFPRWLLLMKEGFNVMLHGYGSKLPVFQSFKSTVEDNFLTVSINGLYPKLNARRFLIDFCKALDLDESFTFSGTNIDMIAEDVYNSLKRHIDCPDVFLLVKNLDTLAVRHPSLLTALSSIARVDFVHILASSDHINPFLGVSQTQTINFNFAWVDCATFHPYEEELTWKPEVFGNDKETNSGKTAFEHVMKSLTANARKAFSILATLQVAKINSLGKSKSKEFSGIEFRELARKCRESFVAHSETALNNLLIEFIDHQLIRHSGKGKTSNNLLIIDLDVDTLNEIINST